MRSVYAQREFVSKKSRFPALRSLWRVGASFGSLSDEAGEIREDRVEDGAVAVRLVDALADVGEELRVVDRVAAIWSRVCTRAV
jgi:hypothetical protein